MKKEIMILIMIVITGLLFITLLSFRDFVGALLVGIALVFEARAFEATRDNI